MAEFEITERTEAFTLDEVFSFIDDTNISKMDAHELKSRIADAVKGIRAKAIDEFAERMKQKNYDGKLSCFGWHEFIDKEIDKIAEELKGVQEWVR